MNRRRALKIFGTGLAMTAVAAGIGGTAAMTFRWHGTARRAPFLTDGHLAGLARPEDPGPRVLFIGNSYTLQHDIPGRVAAHAAAEGRQIRVAMAAAHGARLVQTQRIPALQTVLRDGAWDALVLQDFSDTPLRITDRWGSAHAMARLTRQAGSPPVVLYPTFALPPDHRIYHAGPTSLRAVPRDPADMAARITAFYGGVAEAHGWVRAPVTEALFDDIEGWIADDRHHLNAAGAEVVARVLWDSLRDILP